MSKEFVAYSTVCLSASPPAVGVGKGRGRYRGSATGLPKRSTIVSDGDHLTAGANKTCELGLCRKSRTGTAAI